MGSSSSASAASRSNSSRGRRGSGPSFTSSRRRVASHSLTMPLVSPLSSQATPSRWRASASSSGSSAGPASSSRSRRAASPASPNSRYTSADPSHGSGSSGSVSLQRRYASSAASGSSCSRARDASSSITAGSSGGRLASRAQRPLHGPQVAVLERLPGVVEQAFQLRVRCAVLGHGATVPRRRSRPSRRAVPGSVPRVTAQATPHPCIVTANGRRIGARPGKEVSRGVTYRPKDPRGKLREVATKWTASMSVAGRHPNCGVVFGDEAPTAQEPQAQGWLVDDRRPAPPATAYLSWTTATCGGPARAEPFARPRRRRRRVARRAE